MKARTTMMLIPTTPPTTPPAIAPAAVEELGSEPKGVATVSASDADEDEVALGPEVVVGVVLREEGSVILK